MTVYEITKHIKGQNFRSHSLYTTRNKADKAFAKFVNEKLLTTMKSETFGDVTAHECYDFKHLTTWEIVIEPIEVM